MKYKKILFFGAGGMLGDSFIKMIPKISLFTDKKVCENVSYCDINDFNSTKKLIDGYQPELIINLAAEVDLEKCETNPTTCFLTNTISAIHLFSLAKERDIPYVFISTAGIFGNDKEFYTEEDTPTPLSIYGKSKHYVEQFLINQSYEKWYVFRAGWMMGGGKELDKKFVNKIMKQIYAGSKILRVVDDKLGVPTYTKDFAYSIIKHLENSLPYGLYNQVSLGESSRYQTAEEIVNFLNLDVKVEKIDSDYYKDVYFAPRPYSEKLINKKLNDLGMNYMRDWKLCLHEYLTEFFYE
jgi:dTDP-4-dehydrorhamnose reductase